uniref:Copper transporter n=1 Tax=Steinernema glaseri TaxID=37863 RepID=A0A1I7ZR93_9BILA
MDDVELTRGFMAGGFSGIWCFDKTFKSGDQEYGTYEEFEKAEERRKDAEFDRMAMKYFYAIRAVQILIGAWILTKLYMITVGIQATMVSSTLLGVDMTKRVEKTRISGGVGAESEGSKSEKSLEGSIF